MDERNVLLDWVRRYAERVFNLGQGTPEKWIVRAEADLGIEFPDSYRWFMKNLSGGEVFGDAVFAVYSEELSPINYDDVRNAYRRRLERGDISENELPVLSTDQAEHFVLDLSSRNAGGDCSVCLRRGLSEPEYYAPNFVQFLIRFTREGDPLIQKEWE